MRPQIPGVRLSGIALALLGFAITRALVAEAITVEAVVPFLVGGAVPLVVGLGLTAFGVVLAVGAYTREYVDTVARWGFLGALGMLLIVGITALGTMLGGATSPPFESGAFVANVLLGGTVGGVIIGHRSAINAHQRRELELRAALGSLLNGQLRHEVLNAVTIISGYTTLLGQSTDDADFAVETIRDAADRIDRTVESSRGVVGGQLDDEPTVLRVDELLREERAKREPSDGNEIVFDRLDRSYVLADQRLRLAIRKLLETESESGTLAVEVDATTTDEWIEIRVDRNAPSEATSTETGSDEESPTTAFAIRTVRLLVDHFGGEVHVGEASTVVRLPQAVPGGVAATRDGVPIENASRLGAASLLAGVAMGLLYQFVTGEIPVIGALYGVGTVPVGWITHLFHSVVFGLLFAAICSRPAVSGRASGPIRESFAGAAWGGLLWLVAAGVIMPLWLRFVGIDVPLPNLSIVGLVAHVLWGVVLGGSYAALKR